MKQDKELKVSPLMTNVYKSPDAHKEQWLFLDPLLPIFRRGLVIFQASAAKRWEHSWNLGPCYYATRLRQGSMMKHDIQSECFRIKWSSHTGTICSASCKRKNICFHQNHSGDSVVFTPSRKSIEMSVSFSLSTSVGHSDTQWKYGRKMPQQLQRSMDLPLIPEWNKFLCISPTTRYLLA